MNIAQVRAQYPQYQDLSDKQLADALHAKFYSDIPIQDYYGRIGLTSPKERTFGEAAKDIAASVVSGAGSLVQLPGQLYGLATGDFSETGALGVGKDIAKYGEEMKSAGLKAREAERAQKIKSAEEKGQWEAFKTAFGETVKDPALLTSFLAEQAPQLLVPFGAAKVAQIGTAAKAAAAAEGLTGAAAREAAGEITKAAAQRGTAAAIGAGGVQQGADIGAQAYEDIFKELKSKGATDADAAEGAINLARAAGASGALISLLAQRLPGARTLEESFAGVPGKGGRLLSAAKGALGEGVSEVVEETGGKFGANLAMREVKPEQSLLEGLGQTAGMAAIGGVGMGGVSGLARQPAPTTEVLFTTPTPAAQLPTTSAPPAETPPVSEAPPAEIPPVAETPPIAPPVETPVAETPPVETPPVEPPAEPPPAPPVAETPPEVPKIVTAEMLEEIGVKPTAAIVKRLEGKTTDDPQVARELTNYAKLYAPEDVQPQILNFVETLAPVAAPETTEQRLVRQQQEVDVEAQRVEELNRKQGMPSPDRPKLEITERPSIAETPPVLTPREDLRTKQEEVDVRRLEAGLPTGEASTTPGIQPTPEVSEEPKPIPKIVDERPLATRAAQNRLLVMRNMLQNQGGDPDSLTVVPHPTVEGKFAIQSLDVPTKLTPELQGRKQVGPPVRAEPGKGLYVQSLIEQGELTSSEAQTLRERGEVRMRELPPSERAVELNAEDLAINGYVSDLKKINTPAAREFVRSYESGRFTREDVLLAVKAQRRMAEPVMLNFPKVGEKKYPIFVGPDGAQIKLAKPLVRNLIEKTISENERQISRDVEAIEGGVKEELPAVQYKPRGESELRQQVIREGFVPPPKPETTTPPVTPVPPTPPTDQPAALPKSAFELSQRLPSIMDKADVRKANEDGDIKQLVDSLRSSPNLVTRRIGELGQSIATRVRLEKPGKLKKLNWAGQFSYGPSGEAIKMRPDHAGNEQVNAHEVVHALTVNAQLRPVTDKQKKFSQDIKDIYQHVKKELKKKGVTAYGLQDELEFTAEAMSNPQFQFELMQIPYPGKKNAWSKFVQSVADLLGITNTNALTEVMSLVEKIAETKAPRKKTTGVETIGGELGAEAKPSVVARATATPTGTPGQQALETITRMGMGVKPPEPGKVAKLQQILKDAGENPAGTKASAKAALTKWLDAFETMAFSGDAAFNNKVTSSVIKDMKENEEVLGKLLELSQSQAVNADNVVSRGLIEGSIEYNEEMKKYQSVKKDENFAALIGKLEELSTKYGTSPQEMERIAHAYLVAKRLPGIIKRNEELDTEIAAEEATAKPDRKSIDKWKSLKVYVSPEQEAMVDDGISLGKTIPELSQISDMWNAIRKNNIAVMVESGLYTPEYAQQLWDNMDYVPYYREEQLEADAGPTEFIRGLQVKAKEFQLKGSGAAVNDVFENMMLWSQYAMNRAIRADKARRMIDVGKDIDIGDRKMAVQVKEEKRGMNIVRIFRDGKQELWDVADPMFVDAFASIQNVSIPMFKWAAKVADVLRNSVVLYPMFSVAQVPQDSFAAMFTSGLKPQHALKIPILAVKEFIKTLNKTSATHNELVKYGVVGARNFSAEVMRQDAEIFAGLKPPKGGWNKTKDFLEHIAMSADNAVRQAVYEAAQQQGVSKQEALEKAFEIFNVRRRGTSKALNLAGQTIPFFYAYLAAQRVAYRTITGIGTSPTERKAALQTLAATSAAVFTLSMLYAMMVADDEDYAETPAAVRDRTLTIPGTGGVRIPLRADFFLFPKMVAEHTYLMITDQGYEDGAKFRRSMRDGLINAIASPTPLPQIAKPALEVAINYSFFDGKPVIGTFEKQKDMERQFNDSTSEFSKLLGKTGLVSPIAADHLIRGMLGSAGGLALYGTNMFLHSDPDVPRPEMSWKEAAAALPGTSGFLKRPQEAALKNDFFVLRDEVEKAVNTFNDIKTRSPQGIEDFLADEKQMARLMLGKPVDKINRELSKIRKVITQITNMPENQMSADDKSDNIRQLRELEREILKSVNVKELREMAKI